MIIGLAGRAGSGKDAAADYLCERYGFARYSLASPLRRGLSAMFGLEEASYIEPRKSVLVPWLSRTPRELMQTLGTEWGRRLVAEDVWLRCAGRFASAVVGRDIVISDVRFPNESEWVKAQGGVIVLLSGRAATDVSSEHPSEACVRLIEADYEINNSGTLGDLYQELNRAVAAGYRARRPRFPGG